MKKRLVVFFLTLCATAIPRAAAPPASWTPGENYLRVNGAATAVISTNPFGQTSAAYTPLLQQAGVNGGRIVRIHVAAYYNFITTAANPYDAAWIAAWESVFQQADANGLYVLPVLDVWANWNTSMPGWGSNIFNAGATSFNCTSPLYSYPNCGPANSPDDLLFDPATQAKWLDLIAHLVTEWSDQPNIIGWEVFSELDLIEGHDTVAGCPVVVAPALPCPVVQLFEAAAARIEAIDSRPITASTAGINDMPALWTSAHLDWGQIHPYAGYAPYSGNLDQLILDTVRTRRTQYGKPVFIGESGMDTLFPSDKVRTLHLKPRSYVGINHAIWAGAVSGAMNARALWFEDGYDGVTYDVCTHAELGADPVIAANPACDDGNAATILRLSDLYADAAVPVANFVANVDYAGFEPVPLTSVSGDLIGGALGDAGMVIGWVRDELTVAPLITDPAAAGYNLADHWPTRPLAGQQVTLDMPAGASSNDWLVEFWDTAAGTRLDTIDADQDASGDITFTLRDFEGSIAFKVYPVGPLRVTLNVTPNQPNNNRIDGNNAYFLVAITSNITGAGYPIDVDATTVSVASIAFGPGQAPQRGNLQTDIDGDGDLDLRLRFRLSEVNLPCGISRPRLTGETTTGRSIVGRSRVRQVNCPP